MDSGTSLPDLFIPLQPTSTPSDELQSFLSQPLVTSPTSDLRLDCSIPGPSSRSSTLSSPWSAVVGSSVASESRSSTLSSLWSPIESLLLSPEDPVVEFEAADAEVARNDLVPKLHEDRASGTWLETARTMWDEDCMTSRCLLTLENLSYSRTPRRGPTELLFHLQIHTGIWLVPTALDFALSVSAVGDATTASRKIRGQAELADVVPRPSVSQQPRLSPFRWNKGAGGFRFAGSGSGSPDCVPRSLPIYARVRHTDSFGMHLQCRITYCATPTLHHISPGDAPQSFDRIYRRTFSVGQEGAQHLDGVITRLPLDAETQCMNDIEWAMLTDDGQPALSFTEDRSLSLPVVRL